MGKITIQNYALQLLRLEMGLRLVDRQSEVGLG